MVQEFHVLRCFSCQSFQVQQVKKASRWSCKLCGEKQSLLKEFGRGSAADCRRHVQKLNAMRGALMEEQEHKNWSLWEQVEADGEDEAEVRDQVKHVQVTQAQGSRWRKYLDTPEEVEPDEEEDNVFLMDRQQLHGNNMTDRKRKRREGWADSGGQDSWTPEQSNWSSLKKPATPSARTRTNSPPSKKSSNPGSCIVGESIGGTVQDDERGCTTKHLNLSLHLDFDRHVIRAKVELTVEALEDRFSALTLDTRDLKIVSVRANGQTARFTMGPKHSFKGTPLDITLPFDLSRGQHVIVEVTYETSPSASALQWLSPEQTAGKKKPYLFSQCQAHHCRSMVPCQDSPSVKHTYYAQVSVPKDLVAVMSAVRDGQGVDPQDNNRIVYRFRQPVPIPSYLIAIVVGALESREIGPRSRVWSEKEFVDKAAFEFSETETMLKTAEDLAGPYVWGQYDILVLPPSFPCGGMENPCLTFATPTLLAGDKSLSNVIAHEISHSWTGNLVTNKTWEHSWLNEGHTVYLERMIGRCMDSEQFRQFKAMGGWKELQDSVNTFGANNPLTNLVPSMQDVDPDDAFSFVPYEKGFALLYHLEELMGGPDVFMGFVKSYIQLFAYSSVTTDEWKNYLFTYFKDKVDILNKVDWNAWMFTPGMPPVKPQYDTTLADACIALSQRWIKAKDQDLSSFKESDVKTLSSHQLIEFLSLLLQEDPLPLTHVKKMQEVYDLNAFMNSEIRFRWLRLCVRSRWEEAVPLALKMATEQGRMKFTRPLFSEVFNFEKYRDEALRVFLAHRAAMHPLASGLLAKDLKLDASNTTSLSL